MLHGRTLKLFAGMLACMSALPPLTVRADEQPEVSVSELEAVYPLRQPRSKIRIVEKFAKIVQSDQKIVRVDGFDPEVIGVTAIAVNQIRIQALKPGVTTVSVVDENGQVFNVEFFVTGDVRHLQAYITQMFPDSSVDAVEVQEAVVLRGWVTQPEAITEIVEVAEQFYPRVINQMKVGGVQQVMLKVKVMEVQRSKIRQFGFNFNYASTDGFVNSTPGKLTPLAGLGLTNNGLPQVGGVSDPTLAFGLINPNSVFTGFLEALKQENLLKVKAEPILVTTNGRPATLLNGGEFPILIPQGLGVSSITFKQFGVSMEAVPIILGNGRLRLELSPEVSERDFSNAVDVQGVRVPGLTTRRVNTQVEMKFGQTLMIAGLISRRDTGSTSKIPLFGEIPYIGAAFSRKRYDESETELIVMVTPEYVAPLNADDPIPLGPGEGTDVPTDRELFFDGMLEVPKYGDRCDGCEGLSPLSQGMMQSPSYYNAPPEPVPSAPVIETPQTPVYDEPVLSDPQTRRTPPSTTEWHNYQAKQAATAQSAQPVQRVGYQTPSTGSTTTGRGWAPRMTNNP